MTEIMTKQQNNYLGAIHIHSKFSDGTGDVKTICRAAKAAGLDWIIITDHNNMDVQEGFIDGICVIKGEEISSENNHYIAFGLHKIVSSDLQPQKFVAEVRKQGGFGFAAHPDESESRKNSSSPIKWLDKNIKPDGVEIWNWFSEWADNYSDKNIFEQAYAYLFKHKLVTRPNPETLIWWDELNNETENVIPAIGGVDAHALRIKRYMIPVTIFPYETMFKTITNIVSLNTDLSNDFETAKKQILTAIREGRNLIVNRHICNEVPEINMENSVGKVYPGQSLVLDNTTFINIKLCKNFEIKLVCNGVLIWNKVAKFVKLPIVKKGKYRVEISTNKYGYAYSNPVVVS